MSGTTRLRTQRGGQFLQIDPRPTDARIYGRDTLYRTIRDTSFVTDLYEGEEFGFSLVTVHQFGPSTRPHRIYTSCPRTSYRFYNYPFHSSRPFLFNLKLSLLGDTKAQRETKTSRVGVEDGSHTFVWISGPMGQGYVSTRRPPPVRPRASGRLKNPTHILSL